MTPPKTYDAALPRLDKPTAGGRSPSRRAHVSRERAVAAAEQVEDRRTA